MINTRIAVATRLHIIDDDRVIWASEDQTLIRCAPHLFSPIPTLQQIAMRDVFESPLQASIFLADNGDVYCSGNNSYGQLGLGQESAVPIPQKVPNLPPIATCSPGEDHTILVDYQGYLWVSGSHGNGKLGPVPLTSTNRTQKQFIRVENLPPMVSASAGSIHSLALDTSGNGWGFGSNGYGQLGLGPYAPSTSKTPQMIESLPRLRSVVAGRLFSLFLDESGVIWRCGSTQFPVCNHLTTGSPAPLVLSCIPPASAICAALIPLYLSVEGQVFTSYHRHKRTSSGEVAVETSVPFEAKIESIVAGMQSNVLVDAESNLWGFYLDGSRSNVWKIDFKNFTSGERIRLKSARAVA